MIKTREVAISFSFKYIIETCYSNPSKFTQGCLTIHHFEVVSGAKSSVCMQCRVAKKHILIPFHLTCHAMATFKKKSVLLVKIRTLES